MQTRLLQVEDLRVCFDAEGESLSVVEGVSFGIDAGETTALVGESGCGKSVTALSLARLVAEPPGRYAGGRILFQGRDVLALSRRRLLDIRGCDISYVFQEPGTALNPVFTVGWQVTEALKIHRRRERACERVEDLLGMVGLPDPQSCMRAYPHELSGGMQQRVMIAMALACGPLLLVADEPTTALDVTIQAQILELLRGLQDRFQMAMLLITHNLGLVADTAHQVCVMYAGRIVESGPVDRVLSRPAHPYTRGLLDAVPGLDMAGSESSEGRTRLRGIGGGVPHPAHLPSGCTFWPRCPRHRTVCTEDEPELTACGMGRAVRCRFPLWKGAE